MDLQRRQAGSVGYSHCREQCNQATGLGRALWGGGGEEYVRGKEKRVGWRENTGDNEFPKSHISKC